MPARPEKKDSRKCCCCIPIRAGIIILSIVYFLGGIAAAVAALMVLINGTLELTMATNAIVVVLAILGVFIAIASAIGFSAAVRQHAPSAGFYSNLFYIWYFLELALDIAVIVMFFTKSLDSLIPECASITGRRGGIGRATAERSCEKARNRMSWYYVVGMIVRSLIGYYFARRVSSFSRHCAERAEANLPSSTQMAPTTTAPIDRNGKPVVGTMFASSYPSHGIYDSRSATHMQSYNAATPAAGQPGFPAQNPQNLSASPQGAYPQAYQASADSLQGAGKVEEAPAYYNAGAEKAV